MSDNLTPRQEAFCVAYASNRGNATRAYLEAYRPKNDNTAAACASKLLRNPKILKKIRELQEEAAAPRIAGICEAKALLSDIMRDPDQKAADRIRAAELLVKSAGGFVSVKADENGLSVADNGGGTVIILPTGDGQQGPDEYADLLTQEQREIGWTVIE